MDYWQNNMLGILKDRAVITSTTLSLGEIIGIAIGGAFVLALVLGAIACFCARRRHGRRNQVSEADENGSGDILDIKEALSSIRPPEVTHGGRASSTPFISIEGFDNQEWIAHDPYFNPPVIKPKRHSSHKGFFRASSMRDSWPLVTNIPLSLMPNHTIIPRQVAPPGYIINDPKRPRRSSSLWAKKPSISQSSEPDPCSPTKSIKSTNSAKSAPLLGSTSPKFDHQSPLAVAKRRHSTARRSRQYRRSTSETHLSTILRSTSQRLKAAHRNSITRTLSTMGRTPRPTEKPSDPPIWAAAESREALIDEEYSEYLKNSLHSSVRNRSPSPSSPAPQTSQLFNRRASQTPDQESPDSLCNTGTPDLVIPALLSSPSKNRSPLEEKRHRMRISSGEAKELAVKILKDSRASVLATKRREERLSAPGYTTLTLDPFFSGDRFSRSSIPKSLIPGSRPMHFRKATFGDEPTPERSSLSSPLREVSHNVRTSPKEVTTQASAEREEINPFRWSPQEAMQTRATQTSPKHNGAKRKGHKRSNVMRISNISRPSSIVEIVAEEVEDKSPLTFPLPANSSANASEPDASPCRKPSGGSSIRPPSSAMFNPILSIPHLQPESETDSATIFRQSKEILSPNLSGCNYEPSRSSEDEVFATSKSDQNPYGRNYSSELKAYPTYQLQRELEERLLAAQDELVSFPPPETSTNPSSSRAFPIITSTMTSFHSIPATPILTMPVPSHLTGPRAEPKKLSRSFYSSVSTMPLTISMLRRMNSEVSNHSSASSPVSSPNVSSSFSSFNSTSQRDINRRIRGTKNYLALGNGNTILPRPKNRNSRDSHRISKDRPKSMRNDFERLDDEDSEDEELEKFFASKDMLTPVKEVNSPATISNARMRGDQQGVYLKFPTLNREGSTQPTPEISPHKPELRLKPPTPQTSPKLNEDHKQENSQSPIYMIPPKNPKRFSALTPIPASQSTRRESKMEHPSPLTPNSTLRVAGLRLAKKEKDGVSPESPGLYDEEGFLRGSPDREKVLQMRGEDRKLREMLEIRRNGEEQHLMVTSERMTIEKRTTGK